jgi:hypothetical protein
VLPIHILCFMGDFGILNDHRSIIVLLKLSLKPRIRRGPSLLVRVLISQLL